MFNSPKNLGLIVTAAGMSSRMGMPKGLIEINGAPLLEIHLKNFRSSFPDAPIFLVLGHHQNEYHHLIGKMNDPHLFVVINHDYQWGHFSSIQAGVQALYQHQVSYTFLQPIDLPPLPPTLYQQLYACHLGKELIKPRFEKRSGHPILFGQQIMENIIAADPQSGRLDLLLRQISLEKVLWYDCQVPQILVNLNSPAALHAYKQGS